MAEKQSPPSDKCVCVCEGGFSHRQCGRVRFWQRVHCGQPKLPFFAPSTFFTSSRVGAAPSHPSQRRPTSLLPCHRSKFCKIPRLQCKRINTRIKIATVPREDRGKNGDFAKLSRRRNFPCKCSSASLNITAPAQKGKELQNNLYLFLNIQNLLPSLSYDPLSDFSMLSAVKRGVSALPANNVPAPKLFLPKEGSKVIFLEPWRLYKFGRRLPRLD